MWEHRKEKCRKCAVAPRLRQTGWSDPAWQCPVCEQPYWEVDGRMLMEKPAEVDKPASLPPPDPDDTQIYI